MKVECEFVALGGDELIPACSTRSSTSSCRRLEVTSERRKRLGMSRRYYVAAPSFAAAKGAPFDGPPSCCATSGGSAI